MPSDYVFGAFSPDNDMFVMIGDNGSHINVYETYNLTQMIKIFCSGTFIPISPGCDLMIDFESSFST